MAISMEEKHFYEFGPFRVVPQERMVLRDGQPVPLPPKAFAILMALIQRDGHLVMKDDLMRTFDVPERLELKRRIRIEFDIEIGAADAALRRIGKKRETPAPIERERKLSAIDRTQCAVE